VLHYRHARAGKHQYDEARNIKASGMVAARANDIDGLWGPSLNSRID